MSFIELLYKLILPIAKKEGVDPETVANIVRQKKRSIDQLSKELDNDLKKHGVKMKWE